MIQTHVKKTLIEFFLFLRWVVTNDEFVTFDTVSNVAEVFFCSNTFKTNNQNYKPHSTFKSYLRHIFSSIQNHTFASHFIIKLSLA